MRLPVLVDIITIAARISIILLPADHETDGASDDRTDRRSSARPDSWEDRSGERAGAGADCRPSGTRGDGMIVLRRGGAAA
jgi:hypothetical protein